MRILVMQTTRMGDVLQTTPLVRALRCKYPDAHIAYMVRNMGKAIAQRNPDVNEVLVHEEDDEEEKEGNGEGEGEFPEDVAVQGARTRRPGFAVPQGHG